MEVTSNRWNVVKKIPWVWGKSEKKKYYKHTVDKNIEDLIKEDIENFISLLPWKYLKDDIQKQRNKKEIS